jgi:hypothetical protein
MTEASSKQHPTNQRDAAKLLGISEQKLREFKAREGFPNCENGYPVEAISDWLALNDNTQGDESDGEEATNDAGSESDTDQTDAASDSPENASAESAPPESEPPAEEPPRGRQDKPAPNCPRCQVPCESRRSDPYFTRYYCPHKHCNYSAKVARPEFIARQQRLRKPQKPQTPESDFGAR